MIKLIFAILKPTFGTKRFRKFYTALKNLSLLGLNYRNTVFETNGELFFIKNIEEYYRSSGKLIVIFDIGANVGNYCLELDQTIKAKREIFAFEPFSEVFTKLREATRSIEGLKIFNLGFSDKIQVQKFFSSSAFSEVGSLYEKDFTQFGFSLDQSEEVKFDTVDHFCEMQKIDKIDLLKVDVEGHDFFVLKGAEKMISSDRIDFIQFEYGAANYLSKTYLHDFFQLLNPRYKIFRLLKNGMVEIDSYNTDIEMHVLSNYVAINRTLSYTIK